VQFMNRALEVDAWRRMDMDEVNLRFHKEAEKMHKENQKRLIAIEREAIKEIEYFW